MPGTPRKLLPRTPSPALLAQVGIALMTSVASSPIVLAQQASCTLELTRPARDDARWSAKCEPNPREAWGTSVNLLDSPYTPDCRPGAVQPCFETPEIEIKLTDPSPAEGDTAAPACFPKGASRDVAHMGYLNIRRSCFRALSAQDQKQLKDWGKTSFRNGDLCRMDEFGNPGLDEHGEYFNTDSDGPKIWATRFGKQFPSQPKAKPAASPAEAIYQAFHKALHATETCLQKINPSLASRVRQAMGVEYRAGTGSVYRPSIECAEQQIYQCEGAADVCQSAREFLEPIYREGLDPTRQDEGYARLRKHQCHPAHAPGTILGSIDATHLKPGSVVTGSPIIQVYNANALMGQDAQGASTLFHEFLHAAGATEAKGHNHGTQENELPAGDQVYACQAMAFAPLFEKLTNDQLTQACLTCAGPNGNTAECNKPRKELETLGCRVAH